MIRPTTRRCRPCWTRSLPSEGQGDRVRGVPEARRRSGEEGGGRAGGGTPEPLKHSPALRALYNHLKKPGETGRYSNTRVLELATKIDSEVKRGRPDGWREVKTREQAIKEVLYEILEEEAEVERIFSIIEAQSETDGDTDRVGGHHGGRGLEGHQERPSERLPPTGRVRISAPNA